MRHHDTLSRLVFAMVLTGFMCIPANAAENLSLYGSKGYAYTYSPLPAKGFHLQTGGMYSQYHKGNLRCRDGYIWAIPFSATYGDGNWWEVTAASHWEYWKNTDFDVDEDGLGDVFLAGKLRGLGQDRGDPLDLSLMPFILLPTGDRDESIGDLYLYNPSDDDDFTYGANLLLGYRWDRYYLVGNGGITYVDTDLDYIDDTTYFFGITMEYRHSDTITSYVEFINNQNKNEYDYPAGHSCHDNDSDDDIREIGVGISWMKDDWGFKVHTAGGFTATSPDIRVFALINREFSF